MNDIKIVREKLGLSRGSLAGWLGISTSLVQHAENGTRLLPTGALIRFSKLLIMIHEAEKDMEMYNNKSIHGLDLQLAYSIPAHLTNHRIMAVRLEKRLTDMEKLDKMYLQRSTLIEKLIQANQDGENDEGMRLWLLVVQIDCIHAHGKCNAEKQLPLRARLSGVYAEVQSLGNVQP